MEKKLVENPERVPFNLENIVVLMMSCFDCFPIITDVFFLPDFLKTILRLHRKKKNQPIPSLLSRN